MTLPGGHHHRHVDPSVYTPEHAEALMNERRRHLGQSHWIEIAIGTVAAAAFAGWIAWALLF
jgi:hypothetical protein